MGICALLCFCGLTGVASENVTLIESGKPRAQLSPQSMKSAAAKRLVSMLQQVTGADLSKSEGGVLIAVGPEAAEEAGVDLEALALGEEGFVIQADSGKVVLAGLNERSTDYAVSTFLERYAGVRWFWPHRLGTVIPRKDTISVRIGRRVERPAFAIRWIGNHAEWSRNNRLNVVAEENIGLRFKWFVHTWLRLVPPEKYSEEHPEYYALTHGEREVPSFQRQTQLCTSNPEVADAAARTILELAEQEPDIRVISIDPMDTARMCECENCKALDEPGAQGGRLHSRRVVLFYRDVAQRVLEKDPDLRLKGIVYWSYVQPALDKNLKLPENMMLQLCRFECHNHGLNDDACPFNKRHIESIKGWKEICKDILLYEYYWKVAWREAPWPIIHALKEDLPYAHQIGLLGVASQHADNYASNGLAYYIAAKMLWDPSVDVDALCEDYFLRLFGEEAGRELLGYWQCLEQAAIQSGVHISLQRPNREQMALFTPQKLEELKEYLDRAESYEVHEEVRERIRMMRLAHTHTAAITDYLRNIDSCIEENGSAELTEVQFKRLAEEAEKIGRNVEEISRTGAISGVNVYTRALMNPKEMARLLFQNKTPNR